LRQRRHSSDCCLGRGLLALLVEFHDGPSVHRNLGLSLLSLDLTVCVHESYNSKDNESAVEETVTRGRCISAYECVSNIKSKFPNSEGRKPRVCVGDGTNDLT
jgi:hypothetical protein